MIYIRYPLIWVQARIDKIWQKHHVSPEEVEEAVFDDKLIGHKGTPKGSYCLYGQAMSGRYLFIVLKKVDKGSRYRFVTARDMADKEKRYYKKNRN